MFTQMEELTLISPGFRDEAGAAYRRPGPAGHTVAHGHRHSVSFSPFPVSSSPWAEAQPRHVSLHSHPLIWPRTVCQGPLSALPVSPRHSCSCCQTYHKQEVTAHVPGNLVSRTSYQLRVLATGILSFRVHLPTHRASVSPPLT